MQFYCDLAIFKLCSVNFRIITLPRTDITVRGSFLKEMKNVVMVFFVKNASQNYKDFPCFVDYTDIFCSCRGIAILAFGFLKCF